MMAKEITPILNTEDRGGPAQPLLVVNNLKKYFPVRNVLFSKEKKFVHAVDNVSFTVAKGKTLGIVGESGCGKSTTAKLIARLINPDSGKMVFDGDGVAEYGGIALKEFRKNLQMVFQDSFASLNPRLTIEQTIAYGPSVHGVPNADASAQARALLQRVGLAPELFASRYPHELSGGQRQRVGIARALYRNPNILILDEATSALDTETESNFIDAIKILKGQKTIFIIAHRLSTLENCDRIISIENGKTKN